MELTDEENKLLEFGSQTEGGALRTLYSVDFIRPQINGHKSTQHPYGVQIQPTPVAGVQLKELQTYKHLGSLAETDPSRFSSGYMKYISEYQRQYYKQPTVENCMPRLHDNVEKVFNDIKDSAHLPRPQLVVAPYASMSIDSMPLMTKKKLLEKYYASVKTYYMEDKSLIVREEQPGNLLKTLEDCHYEKERISLKSDASRMNTCDEIEAIARVFYKYHSDIKQISGLQAEIVKLLNRSKNRSLKEAADKTEAEIDKKLERNSILKKNYQLRIPYKKDFGFTGYHPNEATHDERFTATKYPLNITMNGVIEEQYRRRVPVEEFDRDILKYDKECFNSQKVPECFPLHKLNL